MSVKQSYINWTLSRCCSKLVLSRGTKLSKHPAVKRVAHTLTCIVIFVGKSQLSASEIEWRVSLGSKTGGVREFGASVG